MKLVLSNLLLNLLAATVLPTIGYVTAFKNENAALYLSLALGSVLIFEICFYWIKARQSSTPFSYSLRGLLFGLSWLSVFLWLPSSAMALLYAVLSVPLLFSMRILLGFVNETIVATQTILTALGFAVLPFALEQYFTFNSGILTLMIFVWTWLLAQATFNFTPQQARIRVAFGLLVGFLSTEIYVVLLFLPFHYTAQAIMMFLSFYWLWTLCFHFLTGSLSITKVRFYTALCLTLTFLAIISTPWKPI